MGATGYHFTSSDNYEQTMYVLTSVGRKLWFKDRIDNETNNYNGSSGYNSNVLKKFKIYNTIVIQEEL